jgi:hypothetical protein
MNESPASAGLSLFRLDTESGGMAIRIKDKIDTGIFDGALHCCEIVADWGMATFLKVAHG